MADITFGEPPGTWETDADWVGGTNPAVGDGAILGVSSGGCTLDVAAATEALSSFNMTDYTQTFAMGTKNVDSAGAVTLDGTITADAGATIYCGGDLVLIAEMDFDSTGTNAALILDAAGAVSITTGGVTLGDLTINGAGSFYFGDTFTCGTYTLTAGDVTWGSGAGISASAFALDGGTLALTAALAITGPLTLDGTDITGTGDYMLTVDGDVTYVSGTAVNLNVTITGGSHDLSWSSYSADDRFESITIDGTATARMVGGVWCEALFVESGGTLSKDGGARALGIHSPGAGDFLSCTGGTITCDTITTFLYGDYTNSLDVYGTVSCDFSFKTTGNLQRTLIFTGRFEITGTLTLWNQNEGTGWFAFDARGTLECGDIILGNIDGVGENGGGKLILSSLPSVAVIGAISISDPAEAEYCDLTLGSANLTTDGIINGSNQGVQSITVTSVGANIVGRDGTGEIKEVTTDDVIHCWGLIDGGNNNVKVCHESSLGGGVANVGTQMSMVA